MTLSTSISVSVLITVNVSVSFSVSADVNVNIIAELEPKSLPMTILVFYQKDSRQFTVRRAFVTRGHLTLIRQPGCANLIDSHPSLERSHGCKLNPIEWVVKCESLLGGHGKAHRTL